MRRLSGPSPPARLTTTWPSKRGSPSSTRSEPSRSIDGRPACTVSRRRSPASVRPPDARRKAARSGLSRSVLTPARPSSRNGPARLPSWPLASMSTKVMVRPARRWWMARVASSMVNCSTARSAAGAADTAGPTASNSTSIRGPTSARALGLGSSPRSRAPSDSSPCISSTRTSTPPLTAVTSWKVTLGVGRTAASMGPAMVTGAASTALSRASNRSRCAFQSTNSGAASALMMAAISAKARPNSVVCMSLPGRTVMASGLTASGRTL